MKSLFYSKSVLFGATALLLAAVTAPSAQVMAPPYRVNCGGPAFTDSKGNEWEADSHYTGGDTYVTGELISLTDESTLYQTERWFDPARDPLKYDFTVPDGSYMVRLHMAEIYAPWFFAGGRVFNIAINDVAVAENYDIFAEVGGNIASIKEFPVTVTTGSISISFTNLTQHAKVNAIEVLDASTVHSISHSKVNNFLNIKSTASAISVLTAFPSAYSIVLRDITGSKLDQKSGLGAGEQRFNNLRPGVYFVDAKSGSKMFTKKVCVLP